MGLYEEQIANIIQESNLYMLQGKSVLLTGATGMIGKCIMDCLFAFNEQNKVDGKYINVIAISRNLNRAKECFKNCWNKEYFRYICCDVNKEIPECGVVDYIIHAASNTHPMQYSNDPIGTILSNVIGTQNLLEYAVKHHTKRFCFVSSVEVYGENRGDVDKFDEKYLGYIDCNTLRAGYPESKRLGETLCQAYHQSYNIDCVIPRMSRIYGPTMLETDTKAISQFIIKAACSEDIVLKSEGNQTYSYTFVTDAVKALLYILLQGNSMEAYNIADKKSDITLKDLAMILADIAGTQVVYELPSVVEKRGYSTATKAMLDASKLEKLGWNACVHMHDGLSCTVKAIKKKK